MGAVSLLAAAAIAAACPSAPVRYGANAERPSEPAPWVAAGTGVSRMVGFLYTYEGLLGDARIRAAGGLTVYAGVSQKIAWLPRRWTGTGRGFTIEGRRIDGSGFFRSRSTRALAPQFYPSGVRLPSAGCWRLTLRTGTRSWSLHVQAIEPPSARPCDTSRVSFDPSPFGGIPGWVGASPASSGVYATFSVTVPGVGGAAIYAGGRTPDGGNTKILWLIRGNGRDGQIRIRGVRLDGPESFHLSAGAAISPPGAYPSIPVVPTAGCWLFVARSGNVGGAFVFRAIAP